MGVLIDASVLIRHERSQLELEPRLEGREEELFFVSNPSMIREARNPRGSA